MGKKAHVIFYSHCAFGLLGNGDDKINWILQNKNKFSVAG